MVASYCTLLTRPPLTHSFTTSNNHSTFHPEYPRLVPKLLYVHSVFNVACQQLPHSFIISLSRNSFIQHSLWYKPLSPISFGEPALLLPLNSYIPYCLIPHYETCSRSSSSASPIFLNLTPRLFCHEYSIHETVL